MTQLAVGEQPLNEVAAHHARDVLRLPNGTEVEVFDDSGATADGVFTLRGKEASVRVEKIRPASDASFHLTIASAIPKGERADWMIEKLSELGTEAFIPLAASRSVVVPAGENKRQRWVRIATESAKQSRRSGVMRIEDVTTVADLVRKTANHSVGWFGSTESGAIPIRQRIGELERNKTLTVLIGPEGGWTADEMTLMQQSGLLGIQLSQTVLRVETAAVVAAAVVAAFAV